MTLRALLPLALGLMVACNGSTDTTDPSPVDADNDGFSAAEDCNDNDADVFPGADEVCNGIDDDCDNETDEDSLDSTMFFADADDDGFGDPNSPVLACGEPTGAVTNDEDCDDTSDQAFPGGTEVCDGLDNDCDGTVDSEIDVVPRDFATIADALDELEDGSEICLAAGTYTESFDVDGRVFTVSGAPGASFDLSGFDAPLITIVDPETDFTFRGIEVTGLDRTINDEASTEGHFLTMAGGAATLQGVSFVDNAVTLGTGSATVMGGVFSILDAELSLENTVVDGFDLTFAASDGAQQANGGFLNSQASTLVIDGLEVTGLSVTGTADASVCQPLGAFLGTAGGTLTVQDALFEAPVLDVRCSVASYNYGAIALTQSTELDIDGLVVQNGTSLVSSVEAADVGWFYLAGPTGSVADVEIVGNTHRVEASNYGLAYSPFNVLSAQGLEITDLRSRSNVVEVVDTSEDQSAEAEQIGGALILDGGGITATRIQIVGNALSGTQGVFAGLGYMSASASDSSFRNVIVAGNTVSADGIVEGGLYLEGYSDTALLLEHVDLVGNTLSGEDAMGLLYHGSSSINPVVKHVNIVGNTVSGTTVAASVFYTTNADLVDWTFNNVFGNVGDEPFVGLTDPTGSDGNLAVDPLYTDVSSADPAQWDLTLQSGSPVADVGDPGVQDADGSACDLGAFGGPDGVWP